MPRRKIGLRNIFFKPDYTLRKEWDLKWVNQMARDVAAKVENEMDYPGQIKVNIIRETRVIEYAK